MDPDKWCLTYILDTVNPKVQSNQAHLGERPHLRRLRGDARTVTGSLPGIFAALYPVSPGPTLSYDPLGPGHRRH
jgi:hypothetical protein